METPQDLEEALAAARRVRFLCSGNVVRSAFAELLARDLGCPIPVDSAATTYRNPAIFPESRVALLERGVSPESIQAFRPRHLSDVPTEEEEPLVLAMTPGHLTDLAGFRPCTRGHLLGLLDPKGGTPVLADPVLEGASFEVTWTRIERAVRRMIVLLNERSAGGS